MKFYTCQHCGKSFNRRGKRAHTYCSKACHDDARRKYADTPCVVCGKIFLPNHKGHKHCSLECGSKSVAKALSQKVTCICKHCGKEFQRSPSLVSKYCSPHCYWESKYTTPYGYKKYRAKQDFRSTHKQAIQKRDDYKCVLCGSTDHIEVDHILAIALGGTNKIENGQTLCYSCHQKKTAKDKALIRRLNRNPQSRGFFAA